MRTTFPLHVVQNPGAFYQTPHEVRKRRNGVPPSLTAQFVYAYYDRKLRIKQAKTQILVEEQTYKGLLARRDEKDWKQSHDEVRLLGLYGVVYMGLVYMGLVCMGLVCMG